MMPDRSSLISHQRLLQLVVRWTNKAFSSHQPLLDTRPLRYLNENGILVMTTRAKNFSNAFQSLSTRRQGPLEVYKTYEAT